MWHNIALSRTGDVKIDMLEERLTPLEVPDYNLKLSSKRLKSGKCQVKFSASISRRKQLYGYLLVDAEDTLKNVVSSIKGRLDKVKQRDTIHHINLYAVGQRNEWNDNFIVFDA